MRSHRRTAATVIAALAITVSGPAAALAVPADLQYPRPVPETSGPTPSDSTRPAIQRGRHEVRLPRREPRAAVRRAR